MSHKIFMAVLTIIPIIWDRGEMASCVFCRFRAGGIRTEENTPEKLLRGSSREYSDQAFLFHFSQKTRHGDEPNGYRSFGFTVEISTNASIAPHLRNYPN